MVYRLLSGYQDSNLGPPAPKAGALTGLRYIPNNIFNEKGVRLYLTPSFFNCRDTRIRTWDPLLPKQVR